MHSELEIIIGLEVHVQLKTVSKMFCPCNNRSHDAKPNTNVCPICMGFVGTLPLINKKAFSDSVFTGLALGCSIAKHTKWDRKNYFYPDLPKAYQISQYDMPLAYNGRIRIPSEKGEEKTIRVNRLHLEEDAAKLVHTKEETRIDFNRAGTPLMEIVTEPDIRSVEDAGDLLRELRRIVRYLDVSDADMEKGHLRCDASISLRPKGEKKLYPRTEIKNLNSFKMVEKALTFEIRKQKKLWETGKQNTEEITVLWDDDLQKTKFMRDKEGAADYRYFPEPDIPEVDVTEKEIQNYRNALPVLPAERIQKYLTYGLDSASAFFIVENKELSDYVDHILNLGRDDKALLSLLIKWCVGELFSFIKKESMASLSLSPKDFLAIAKSVQDGKVSRLIAKKIFQAACAQKMNVSEEIKKVTSAGNCDAESIIKKVITDNPTVIAEYKSGKGKALNVLIGSVVKESKGSIPPPKIIQMLKEALQ
jgi:aspartyl-tRNA(Asn)/glutamyl-tRNA(Gln) amidotransferase subunit B